MNGFAENEVNESPIDIKEYFYLFWGWAWLIALAGILAGVAAYAVSIRMTPIYEASTRLLVSAPSSISGVDPSALVTTQTMTMTYSQMLLDRPVLQGVIDRLELPTTSDDLKKVISVDVVTNTQLMTITVQDPEPVQAANIANSMAAVFTERIRELQSQRYSASREGLQQQMTDMESQIASTNAQIALTTDPAALEQLQARLTQYRTIYSNLVTSYEQVRLADEQTSTNVVVSEPASAPTIPVSPKTTRNVVLAAMAGMLLAAGVVFAADSLDDSIKNPEVIQRRFGLPILGMIASHQSEGGRPIALNQPRSPVAEAFRSLRTNLTFTGVDTPLRRILITSPTPEDGKTMVSANLAVVMAQGEKKVVLIDADLRRPKIHQKFGMVNASGLTDLFVTQPENYNRIVHSNGVPRLSIVSSGPLPPNPAELLTSQKMIRIMDQLSKDSDMIVIDTPPVLTVTDAAGLAPAVDGVVLVVKPGKTKMSALQQAVEQLRAVGARVLGVVMNEVNPRSRRYGYYYHRYYSKYSHYYQTKPKGRKATDEPKTLPNPVPAETWPAVAIKMGQKK